MRVGAEYVKNDKVYRVQKQGWRPRRITLWLLVPLVVFLVMGVYCLFAGIGMEKEGATDYEVAGKIDYKVYLKQNDYYKEKFLGPNMQYIASLINVIHTNFDYSFSANDDLQVVSKYKVVAQTKVTDRNDASKVLYDVSEDLVKEATQTTDNGELEIKADVDIDYDKYNQKMREFRSTFGVAADCQLVLKLVVNLDGAVKEEEVLAMTIPLSEQTVDIDINTEALNKTGQIGEVEQVVYVKNGAMVTVGGVIVVMSLILIGAVIYYYVTRFNDDLYEKALHKILKEYDTYIVEASGTVYEMENVVRVLSFRELLDAQNLEKTPILFLEVEPGNKAYFIVNGANTTYRFTLSRAYQEKMKYGVDEEEIDDQEDEDDEIIL